MPRTASEGRLSDDEAAAHAEESESGAHARRDDEKDALRARTGSRCGPCLYCSPQLKCLAFRGFTAREISSALPRGRCWA